MIMPEILTLAEASSLGSSTTNFDNHHGVDINKVFGDINQSDSKLFHESRRVIEVDIMRADGTPDKIKFLDVGTTYRRSDPKPMSKTARKRAGNYEYNKTNNT